MINSKYESFFNFRGARACIIIIQPPPLPSWFPSYGHFCIYMFCAVCHDPNVTSCMLRACEYFEYRKCGAFGWVYQNRYLEHLWTLTWVIVLKYLQKTSHKACFWPLLHKSKLNNNGTKWSIASMSPFSTSGGRGHAEWSFNHPHCPPGSQVMVIFVFACFVQFVKTQM